MIFVDTSYWVAPRMRRDERHARAAALFAEHHTAALITTTLVVGETWTFLNRRAGRASAVDFLDRVDAADRLEVLSLTADTRTVTVRTRPRRDGSSTRAPLKAGSVPKPGTTRMVTEISLPDDRGTSTDTGSTRSQHEYCIDPNEIRRRPPGMWVVIGNGEIKPVPDMPEQDAAPEPSEQLPDPGRLRPRTRRAHPTMSVPRVSHRPIRPSRSRTGTDG